MKSDNNVQRVASLDTPGLLPYRTLRRPAEHILQGIFVAEGEKVVRRLIDSELVIVSMLMTPAWYERLNANGSLANSSERVQRPVVYIAEKQLLETIVGYNVHQGIMAVGEVPKKRTRSEILEHLPHPQLIVALEGLQNAENVGVVVRNSAAFGVDLILVGETSSSPYLRRSVRNSMGTVFLIPIVHAINLPGELQQLHLDHGMAIIAAHPRGELTIQDVDLTGNVCLVLGSEGDGVSEQILNISTGRVAIPMMNGTDSLNVASASAVFLYEARRQRGA